MNYQNPIAEYMKDVLDGVHENIAVFKNVRDDVTTMRYLVNGGPCYSLKVHDIEVLKYLPDDWLHLNSNGWMTRTTKTNINEFLPFYLELVQSNKKWILFLSIMKPENIPSAYKFMDEMIVDLTTCNIFYLWDDSYLSYEEMLDKHNFLD